MARLRQPSSRGKDIPRLAGEKISSYTPASCPEPPDPSNNRFRSWLVSRTI